jgi:hypothetical protein
MASLDERDSDNITETATNVNENVTTLASFRRRSNRATLYQHNSDAKKQICGIERLSPRHRRA